MTQAIPGDASVVADLVTKHIEPKVVELEGPDGGAVSVLVLPSGLKAHSVKPYLEEFRTAPERRVGVATLQDLDSFVAHARRFKDAGSALFANPDPAHPSLTSVLDYHPEGAASSPRFGKHRGVYAFPLSDEWTAWTEQDGADPMFTQQEFAEFIEERIVDIADPAVVGGMAKELVEAAGVTLASPSRLLELSRGLTVNVGSRVQNAVNLATGEGQLNFSAEHSDGAGAPVKVPTAFLIALAVFRNGAPYQLAARLRYRVAGGSVSWFYELYRADRIFDHAFKEACALARTGTELPLFIGAPEP